MDHANNEGVRYDAPAASAAHTKEEMLAKLRRHRDAVDAAYADGLQGADLVRWFICNFFT